MTAPAKAPGFDPGALRDYLDAAFGRVRAFSLHPVAGGQSNPTYFVTHGARRMVLRKQPTGPILPGAHAIDREYRVLCALHPAGLPVPRPILFHAAAEPLGTPFYLMERVEGRVFAEAALPGLPVPERRAIWMAMADVMAALHALRPDQVGLAGFGRPGGYFARQLRRWSRAMRDSPAEPIPELERLCDWLGENLPAEEGEARLAHGDFRMGNLMFHPTEPRVVAILDWELATLGPPMADLGFACMAWHSAAQEYGGLLGLDLGAEGLPEEAEFIARYGAGGADLRPFHRIFALFRFAVIFRGIGDRAQLGTASSAEAARLAPLARCFAIRGCDLIERLAGS